MLELVIIFISIGWFVVRVWVQVLVIWLGWFMCSLCRFSRWVNFVNGKVGRFCELLNLGLLVVMCCFQVIMFRLLLCSIMMINFGLGYCGYCFVMVIRLFRFSICIVLLFISVIIGWVGWQSLVVRVQGMVLFIVVRLFDSEFIMFCCVFRLWVYQVVLVLELQVRMMLLGSCGDSFQNICCGLMGEVLFMVCFFSSCYYVLMLVLMCLCQWWFFLCLSSGSRVCSV